MKAFALIAALALAGCGGDSLDGVGEVEAMLPAKASNPVDAGNGWVLFDFSGKRYLMSPTGGLVDIGLAGGIDYVTSSFISPVDK